jgi:protease IV
MKLTYQAPLQAFTRSLQIGTHLLSIALVSATTSCKGNPTQASDPWAAKTSAVTAQAAEKDSDDDASTGGIQQILAKVVENLGQPGPYEAPEKSADFDAAKPYWGVMDVGGDIVERSSFSLTSGSSGSELQDWRDRLSSLSQDKLLTGLVMRFGGLGISVPDALELRSSIAAFRASGKRVACHSEGAGNVEYLVMAACDDIGLAPLGEIGITGPTAMPMHLKPLMDRFAVKADFLHVGAYKGAAEPLTKDAPSAEMLETLGAILDQHYQTMVEVIGADRKMTATLVKQLIDNGMFPSVQALAAKLVDEVSDFESFRDKRAALGWQELPWQPDDNKNQAQALTKLMTFVGMVPSTRPTTPHVAVVYAIGDIVDGGGDGIVGARQQIASHTLIPALHALTIDDNVKAVVLRIDSGGGSAQASELIWQAVTALKAKKPVIVSMSDVAASGGYYIACNATKIYAMADTLTGSIGVVGGRIAIGDALSAQGIKTFPIGRGKRATMMASLTPWTADERSVIQQSMEAVYNVFVSRVAAGRGKTPAQIQTIAQGHVWTGARGKELGLVDEIGGLDAAIAEARKLGTVTDDVALEIYPSTITLRDVVGRFGSVHMGFAAALSTPPRSVIDEMLQSLIAIDPQLARSARHLLQLAMGFQTTHIQTVALLPLGL